MSLEEKLRPCLFCGSNGVKIMRCDCECARMRKPHYVLCGACGANGPVNDEPGKYWNKAHCWKLLDEKDLKIDALEKRVRFWANQFGDLKLRVIGGSMVTARDWIAKEEAKASKDEGDK